MTFSRLWRTAGYPVDILFLAWRVLVGYTAPVIFAFHNVNHDPAVNRTNELPLAHNLQVFRAFVFWLVERAKVVPLLDLVRHRDRVPIGRKERMVALTFDDGFEGHYSIVYPILRQLGCPTTFFIPTGMIGQANRLTEQMLHEMSSNGMSIGSHTVSHPRLSMLGPEAIAFELRESRSQLEEITGRPCLEFAYPYGDYGPETLSFVRRAGYECAVTLSEQTGLENPFALPRTSIRNGISRTEFAVRLNRAQVWRRHLRGKGLFRDGP